MNDGELKKQFQQKIRDGQGRVSFSFGISPIIDNCLADLLRGQPELSPQTLRWLNYWFGFDYTQTEHESSGCGIKILADKQTEKTT